MGFTAGWPPCNSANEVKPEKSRWTPAVPENKFRMYERAAGCALRPAATLHPAEAENKSWETIQPPKSAKNLLTRRPGSVLNPPARLCCPNMPKAPATADAMIGNFCWHQ